ncbi:MAG: CAF17-like 4Fe-4S cluster assembly/insertion protein YgfZ [Limisphaerales bacterium]
MNALNLHKLHQRLNAHFSEVNGQEMVGHYGDPLAEQEALRVTAGVLDLSFRSRLCLTGADRQRFLNGQVSNNVKDLAAGQGCYAALVTAKGKIESDLNIYRLENELLLDFEPGLTAAVTQRFEKYIIADDVQIVDAAPHYGLLSVQGPNAEAVVRRLEPGISPPGGLMNFAVVKHATLGEIYLINLPRTGSAGFDVFAPTAGMVTVMDTLIAAAQAAGGCACGWRALETARIEAGIPRFGADMDASNLAPEAGIESRAISYTKGCYIGQEVIARIRTYGQVSKTLCGLRLAGELNALPQRGDKLFKDGKEVGYATSAVASPTLKANIALGYVRREASQIGTPLSVRIAAVESPAVVVALPFAKAASTR